VSPIEDKIQTEDVDLSREEGEDDEILEDNESDKTQDNVEEQYR
jgi:hypothetical protein